MTQIELSFSLTRRTGRNNTLKKGNQMINANDRMHYIVKSQITDYLRTLAYETASEQVHDDELPLFDEQHQCAILVDVKPPTNRRFDPPNIYPTVKALIDGLTDAGIWEDDNGKIIKMISFISSCKSNTKDYEVKLKIGGI